MGFIRNLSGERGSCEAQLFLACMVGPFGVWIRWFLARYDGRGLGRNNTLRWMPFGTLAANILAACVMAALATLKKAWLIYSTLWLRKGGAYLAIYLWGFVFVLSLVMMTIYPI